MRRAEEVVGVVVEILPAAETATEAAPASPLSVAAAGENVVAGESFVVSARERAGVAIVVTGAGGGNSGNELINRAALRLCARGRHGGGPGAVGITRESVTSYKIV